MPELPEVEIVKRGLEPAITGKVFKRAQIRRSDLRVPVPRNFKSVIEGQSVRKISRRGKYILIFLEGGQVVVLHLGMSGRIHIHEPGAAYKPEKHDHVILDMDDGGRIVFNDPRRFGMLYMAPANDWEKQDPFLKMGPEPLGNEFSGPCLEEKLRGRKSNIKSALLDQKIVAGIGNIYACEALFESGINPERAAGRIAGKDAECLAGSIRSVLQKAIAAGGSSLKDYRQTDGSLGYFQHAFSVYDKEGKKCPGCTCDTDVRRIVQAGRSTFFCPVKQR
ncbi:MAG: formamidopyrimidine-DNA glycosylase [Micavibrio sp.]|nr:MAG: formamidopyrimidine-DNA glycosylase [Micavibrio sp.]